MSLPKMVPTANAKVQSDRILQEIVESAGYLPCNINITIIKN